MVYVELSAYLYLISSAGEAAALGYRLERGSFVAEVGGNQACGERAEIGDVLRQPK
jgi:hypothetical protein